MASKEFRLQSRGTEENLKSVKLERRFETLVASQVLMLELLEPVGNLSRCTGGPGPSTKLQ